MNPKQLMKLFLECPDTIRNVVISDNQAATVRYIRDCGYPNVSAREIADEKDITIQSASVLLATLWRRGWLKRMQYADSTGGIYYRYSSIV